MKAKEIIFRIRIRMAIARAKSEAKLFDRKYLVIVFNGKPEVFQKKKLKELLKRGFFRKGTTIEQLEKMAYFITR